MKLHHNLEGPYAHSRKKELHVHSKKNFFQSAWNLKKIQATAVPVEPQLAGQSIFACPSLRFRCSLCTVFNCFFLRYGCGYKCVCALYADLRARRRCNTDRLIPVHYNVHPPNYPIIAHHKLGHPQGRPIVEKDGPK